MERFFKTKHEEHAKRKLAKTVLDNKIKRARNSVDTKATNQGENADNDPFNDSIDGIEEMLLNTGDELLINVNNEKSTRKIDHQPKLNVTSMFAPSLFSEQAAGDSEDMFADVPSFMASQFCTPAVNDQILPPPSTDENFDRGYGQLLGDDNLDSVFNQVPLTCKLLVNDHPVPKASTAGTSEPTKCLRTIAANNLINNKSPTAKPPKPRKNSESRNLGSNPITSLLFHENQPVQKPSTPGTSNSEISLRDVTDQLNESHVHDKSNTSVTENSANNVSVSARDKLMANASNVGDLPASSTRTGWTQFQKEMSQSFLIKDSQFHEIGPYYGLPAKVQELVMKHKGIDKLYDWQIECLNLPAVNERKNLVYALPTSGGKTLVAEILMLREVLCRRKSVLFVLPFVAIVQEKVRSLSPFAVDLGFLVEEYAAGKGLVPPRKRRRRKTIYIATIEKALAIVHSLIETGRLSELGLVVVDELHLISEGSGRGAAMEAMLTYIIHCQEKIHLVGMSATIGNVKEIAQFLHAETYLGSFRPVELTEYVTCDGEIFAVNPMEEDPLVYVKRMRPIQKGSIDSDGVCQLVEDMCPSGSVLVFCPTKKNCENVSSLLCKYLPRKVLQNHKDEKAALISTLKTDSNGKLCPILSTGIRHGVAYHHSGLTADERKLVEEAFREGILFCICCTSTLAAGVNLPAQRVILRAPYIGREFINLAKYKQMIGRAGRAGYGSRGESFLICQSNETAKVIALLISKMDDAVSSLTVEDCKDLILSAVGLGIATTREKLRNFLYQTLLHSQAERLQVDVKKMADQCITSLYKQGAIGVAAPDAKPLEKPVNDSRLDVSVSRANSRPQRKIVRIANTAQLSISRLGKAALKGCMSLPVALKLYGDLEKAESSLVLLCSLHILYLVTPYQLPEQMTPNYPIFFDVFMKLSAKEQLAAKVIGLTENNVSRMGMGQKPKNVPEETLSRFYVTLILNELWKQQSVWDVAALFQIPRGLVQNLMSCASSFSWNVLRFCEELEELWSVKAILGEFSPRMAHCCETELLPLMELPAIKRGRAKQLFDAGYKTLQSIAKSEPKDLVAAVPHLPVRVATQIISAARMSLMQKIENLQEEAEEVLEDLGENSLAGVLKNI